MRILAVAFALAAASSWSAAQTTAPQQPGNDQVIQPQVERREVKLPKYPSKDFEIGGYLGTYAMQNFGSSLVAGVRLGYHISEDIFVQAVYAQTKVSDENFRQILPGGIFAHPEETLTYYNLSAGYNILPGEVFWGRNTAFASALYVIAGIGNTNFIASDKVNHRNRQTINYGAGIRVLFHDRFSVQMDMRQHIFDLDILGQNQSTKNLEWTGGVSFYF
ncbi:MAG TPA: outer membrane beta-barrel domain-containing protein [Burkholderiaceae bacterium]|jgi:outer membrane beta-barrel protein|nr:outer membrane beta-barrel domain-containing protein [Burkholderiaceae bacterium]